MKFDSTKAILDFILWDEKLNDGGENASKECNLIATIPLSSIDSVKEYDEHFCLEIAPEIQSTHQFDFEIPIEKGCRDRSFIDGLRKFLHHDRPSHMHSRDFKLRMLPDPIFPSSSLVTDLPKEKSFFSKENSTTTREVRVFETDSNNSCRGASTCPPASPADQGMELALIGPLFGFSDAPRNLNMPNLSEGKESNSFNQPNSLPDSQNHEEHETDIELQEIPGDFMGDKALQANPSSHESSTSGPWCEADLCTLTIQEISEAFSDIFGVRKMSPNHASGRQYFLSEDTNASDYMQPPFMGEACIGINQRSCSSASEHNFQNDNIRNRKNMNAKAQRRQELLYKLSFAAVKEVAAKKMFHIQTNKSSDEADLYQSNPTQLSKTKSFINIFGQYVNSNERRNGEDEPENVLYYDSDLEDARERTFFKGPRQASAEKMNKTEESRFRSCGNKLRIPRKILQSSSVTSSEIKTIVSMMKAFTFTLLWHPNPTKEDPFPTPLCVQAWIERGTYLMNQNYVQPKFMWKAAFEGELASKRKINLDIEKFGLLEIARIDGSPKDIDRSIFPFAHKPSCFVIKTKTNYFLFQAQSATEQAHIVFGLKLVVARLASLLIVRHMAAVEEFFEPNDSAVPGKIPSCITGKHDTDGNS
eukprot:CAMPEP_0194225218 /NCGR_PEP_ID=MMETSP0156-20130528/39082_1 /TAXON_ID=33649 /ORGANISM="Thalassionema nitzschioides, Strain L26-B" /LENGTH=645 /DNA_ID=CAMNT_0038957083 /DNA_START=581 /DNA_END=2518 /DNA_ORIENTATION=+